MGDDLGFSMAAEIMRGSLLFVVIVAVISIAAWEGCHYVADRVDVQWSEPEEEPN